MYECFKRCLRTTRILINQAWSIQIPLCYEAAVTQTNLYINMNITFPPCVTYFSPKNKWFILTYLFTYLRLALVLYSKKDSTEGVSIWINLVILQRFYFNVASTRYEEKYTKQSRRLSYCHQYEKTQKKLN